MNSWTHPSITPRVAGEYRVLGWIGDEHDGRWEDNGTKYGQWFISGKAQDNVAIQGWMCKQLDVKC